VDEDNHVRVGADTEREAKNLARELADTADAKKPGQRGS
jgi:hypothetical protein